MQRSLAMYRSLSFTLLLLWVLSAGVSADEGGAPPLFRAFEIQSGAGLQTLTPHTATMPVPQLGAIVPLKIFFREAVGHRAFGYIFTFESIEGMPEQSFNISAARAWLRYAERDASGSVTRYVRIAQPINTPTDSPVGRAIVFAGQPVVPPDGLIAEFQLEILRTPPRNSALRLHIYVAVISETKPERILKYEGLHTVRWR